jgi:dihydrofolate reductase
MGKVRVGAFSVSVDGFGAGPEQSLDDPLGKNGEKMHGWFFPTRFFRTMIGKEDGETGIDNDFGTRAMTGFGAFILGRNMYGPIRGEWNGTDWKGWWGDNPPYHAPTYILTHHPHPPIEMEGGTTFIFVTDGIESALEHARRRAISTSRSAGACRPCGNIFKPV